MNFALGSALYALLCCATDQTRFYGFSFDPTAPKAFIIRHLGEKDGGQVAEANAEVPSRKWLTVNLLVRGGQIEGSVREAEQDLAIASISHRGSSSLRAGSVSSSVSAM